MQVGQQLKPVGSKRLAPKALPASKAGETPSGSESGSLLDQVKKGLGWTYQQARRQSTTAASVSTNLRMGSRQLRAYLTSEMVTGLGVASMVIGLAAAGLRATDAGQKLWQSTKKRDLSLGLDGLRDLGSAGVLALSSASKFALRTATMPFYGGIGALRGGYNFFRGLKSGNPKLRTQGALDGIRSLGLTARSLRKFSPMLFLGGKLLAPVAGTIQAGQGLHSLSQGLKQNNNRLELKGLVDVASAVGTTLLITGMATTPGLVLFSSAQFLYSAYHMNSWTRRLVDKGIDSCEPAAKKALTGVQRLGQEVVRHLVNPFWPPGVDQAAPGEPLKAPGVTRTARRLEEDTWELDLDNWKEEPPDINFL